MKWWKDCPWYVWAFSFLSAGVLMFVIWARFVAAMFRKGSKLDMELWFRFMGEWVLDMIVLAVLPLALLTPVLNLLLPEWAIGWVVYPVWYLIGTYAAARMWRWREKYKERI